MRHQRLFVAALALFLTVLPAAGSAAADSAQGEEVPHGPGFGARALQALIDGIQFGVIIAITAVGLSLIFGTIHLINFAHGELVTIGATSAFFLNVSPAGPGWHLVPAALAAVAFGALLGAAIDRGVWRPLRARGTGLINMFIVTIGLSLLLRHIVLVLYGARPGSYAQYDIQQAIDLGPAGITPRDLTVTVLSLLTLLGVAALLQRTRIGTAIRAVSGNRDLAEASGIDVQRVVLVVWMLGGALAALGGVFFGLVEVITWDMGFKLLLLMFAGVILGGLGNAYGAMAGSLVIGVVAQMSTLWFPVDLQYAWALLALIIVLLVRPQGILGRAERIG
ncbi:branched-chain amino acid ABC transporter permease [Streptomyces sp. ISL-10]|uniref:branched-chain amino acid ABC transporter permease n=1 Tax=Streptomyces sp. ISL-10 TaxID=2819172 RepID=UPI001BEC9381|nr:branched-chain amino acid ABC transporter permease [Streptomyces sp. ISL-10]MBT2369782.1 branched-chain amino acid ABC transporter permease [Streptomyces sp. ISL-10]